jgi:hypothetical protein
LVNGKRLAGWNCTLSITITVSSLFPVPATDREDSTRPKSSFNAGLVWRELMRADGEARLGAGGGGESRVEGGSRRSRARLSVRVALLRLVVDRQKRAREAKLDLYLTKH